MAQVLEHEINIGYTKFADLFVQKVNGVIVKTMKQLLNEIKKYTSKYV